MIINTGNRTDIPAFYSEWFINRLNEGYVMVRSPYAKNIIYHYELNPNQIDGIIFCTKNPKPMLKYMNELANYRQYWMVSITPYGHEIETNVPNKNQVIRDFISLSKIVGKNCIAWRYDPIILYGKYTIDYHLNIFSQMLERLAPYTNVCIISFVDLYEKTKRNFPQIKEVSIYQQITLIEEMVKMAKCKNVEIKVCAESLDFSEYGINQEGCVTKEVLQKAWDIELLDESKTRARKICECLLENDIGAYDTCLHGCKYCYATSSFQKAIQNKKRHIETSPLLIGEINLEDKVVAVKGKSMVNRQLNLFNL